MSPPTLANLPPNAAQSESLGAIRAIRIGIRQPKRSRASISKIFFVGDSVSLAHLGKAIASACAATAARRCNPTA
jgi:hypothetical protein